MDYIFAAVALSAVGWGLSRHGQFYDMLRAELLEMLAFWNETHPQQPPEVVDLVALFTRRGIEIRDTQVRAALEWMRTRGAVVRVEDKSDAQRMGVRGGRPVIRWALSPKARQLHG